MPAVDEKQNITLRLSKQTIHKARILAAKRSTSISGLLTSQIEELAKCDLKHILAGNKAYFGRLKKTSCVESVCVLQCTYTNDESGNNRRCNALVPKGSRKALASGHRVAFPTKEPLYSKALQTL